ncbi:MAG TPA: CvpA family protein [Stellaceae bacterium]|jgi:membrane protein required for colicin V production|nr:CvpA family protein [Stellaceae bacterium]
MNPVDIGVIAVVGLSAVFAFARGFVREALSIVAWIGAGFITLYGFTTVYAIVDPMVHNPLLSQLIAGFGLFVASLIVLTILTGIVARTVRASGLSPIDRTLGFVFGILRGAFILSLAYLLVEMVQPNDRPPWLRDAKSAPYLQQGADILRGFLPESLRMKSAAAADDVLKTLSPAAEAEKAMRAFTNPTAPATTAPDQQSGAPAYKPGDQREFDRLINNQR